MRDLYSNLGAVLALVPAVQAATIAGAAIDLLGNSGVTFAVATGAIVGDGDFGVTIQESDDGSTGWANAPADHIQSDAPATLEASSAYRLGYIGWKRHVRLSLTKDGGTSIAAGAVAILRPDNRPVA